MIQLGIRLHDTAELPFEERLETVRAQGFSCVHLALSKVSGLPSAPETLTPGYAMALRHLFDKKELDIAVLGCYLNLGNPDAADDGADPESVSGAYPAGFAMSGLRGSRNGNRERLNEDYHYDPQDTVSQQALELLIRNLRPIVSLCGEDGRDPGN
jgi:sugar phosphate isomerase/epimerase